MTHPINVEFEGCVLAEHERNGYNDSDWYVIVWDIAQQCVRQFDYATTRGGFGEHNNPSAVADATPAIRARAAQWQAERERKLAFDRLQSPADPDKFCNDSRGAHDPRIVGNLVTVYKGRKVPKGTTGRVLHCSTQVAHTSRYGTWTTTRDMLTIDTGTGFQIVNADNCRTVELGQRVLQEIFDLAEAC